MLAQTIYMLKTYLVHSMVIIPEIITKGKTIRNTNPTKNIRYPWNKTVELVSHQYSHHQVHTIHLHHHTLIIADSYHLYHQHHNHITLHHNHQFGGPHYYRHHQVIVHQHNSHHIVHETYHSHQHNHHAHSVKICP